ncbi:hypothetical protein JXQ70_18295 [bacterium]|nr:hypothetical protein [bacterium]
MRKGLMLCLICSMLLFNLFFCTETQAVESLTVGLRYWYPQWELDGYSDFETLEWDTDFGMIGPSASFVINERFALTASLYFGSFEKDFDRVIYNNAYTEADWSSDRKDFDLIGVFMLNKYVSFFGGLKYLTYDQTITGTWFGSGSWELKYDIESMGPGLGSSFNLPLNSLVSLYSTLSYSYLVGDFKTSIPSMTLNEGDVTYPIFGFELGSRFSFSNLPLVLMASFRYQQSTINVDWDEQWSDSPYWDELDETFMGLILFLGYRFDFN